MVNIAGKKDPRSIEDDNDDIQSTSLRALFSGVFQAPLCDTDTGCSSRIIVAILSSSQGGAS
jgi:hypothetical protein